MPFSVLIVEKDPSTREDLARLFREQFGDESDLVITVGEPAEFFGITQLREGQNFDLIVYRISSENFQQNETFFTLVRLSLFRALYYKSTGNQFDDHMLSCHSGDVTVAIDEPDWGMQLAKKAKEFLCSQLVNGGLDALFNERDHQYPASPYEGRFRRFFVHGKGLDRALAELIGAITDYWNFLDERTRKRVKEQFHVDLDHEIDGQKYPVFVTLRRLPSRPS